MKMIYGLVAGAGCLILFAGCGGGSTPEDSATETATDPQGSSTATTGEPTSTSGATESSASVSATGTESATGATASATATESTTNSTESTGNSTEPTTNTTEPTTNTTEPTTDTTDTTEPTTTDGPPVCGNGVVEAGEECDDGNLVDGDGCESNCLTGEVLCGNSVIDPGESCDDGNNKADDGCGSQCVIECGFLCLELGEPCVTGFNAVQCASPGPPWGQPSPIGNTCRLATLSVNGDYIALSPGTTIDGKPRHLDAMYTDAANDLFGFAGNTEKVDEGSQLVAVDAETGELTPVGPSLGVWIMGAAMNDEGQLWVTVFDAFEFNGNAPVSIARVDPGSGMFIDGPDVLTEGGKPLIVWSSHVSDVAFRFDGAMFISANEAGPPPPEPLSRYLEVDRATAKVLSAVDGPDDIYAAGIVFIGEEQKILAMDIRGADDIFILDLSAPPTLNETLLYPDPIPTNSGTADLAGCAKLNPQ